VFFLNIVGVPYPDVDVDQVRELADSAREFAVDIRATFDAATGTLDDMGSAMSGDSYQAIIAGWAYHYDRLTELDDAFEVAATALDIAADVIEAIQIAVLIELAALAASFIAGMFTPAGPVTGPMIAAAARYIAKEMAKVIMWYLAAEVAAKAIEPLVERFNRFIREALQPPEIPLTTTGSGKYYLDPDMPTTCSHMARNSGRSWTPSISEHRDWAWSRSTGRTRRICLRRWTAIRPSWRRAYPQGCRRCLHRPSPARIPVITRTPTLPPVAARATKRPATPGLRRALFRPTRLYPAPIRIDRLPFHRRLPRAQPRAQHPVRRRPRPVVSSRVAPKYQGATGVRPKVGLQSLRTRITARIRPNPCRTDPVIPR
jgi:hypothetical protein